MIGFPERVCFGLSNPVLPWIIQVAKTQISSFGAGEGSACCGELIAG